MAADEQQQAGAGRDAVPAGFQRVPTGLGFTDVLQPLYRSLEGDRVRFGLRVIEAHANIMGICHGGVLATLADITAATGVNHARGERAGNPTISLSLDFIGAGRLGDWLEATVMQVDVKRRFGFCSGLIEGSSGVVARFNGTIYLPDHAGIWKRERPAADLLSDPPGE
ncbi:PaaI family thioesterase [Haliea atlantica]|jgi:uncharacterized protein (TIGR00369 family)